MYQVVEKSQLITGRTPKRRHEGVQRQKSRYLPGHSDSFLETFFTFRHFCIKHAILEKFLSRHWRDFVAGFGISYLAQRNDESQCAWASPLPRAATQTWPERSSGSFHSRRLIHFPAATESTPGSQDHQKLLPKGWPKQTRSQKNESLKKSLELPRSKACRPNWRWWSSAISYYNGLQWRDIDLFFNIFKIFISMISIILKVIFALAKLNLDKIVHLHKYNSQMDYGIQ